MEYRGDVVAHIFGKVALVLFDRQLLTNPFDAPVFSQIQLSPPGEQSREAIDSLQSDYAKSTYASLGSLAMAGNLVEQGLTYEQVAANSPTVPYEAKWGSPERFLTAVYEELSAQ